MNGEISSKTASQAQQLDAKIIAASDVNPIETLESTDVTLANHVSKRPVVFSASTTSLTESSSCTHHQYHYIQYPAFYQAPTCHCHCACGTAQDQQRFYHQAQVPPQCARSRQHCHPHKDSVDSQIIVQVHQAAVERERDHPTKAQSEQSLLNHSYQALQLQPNGAEDKPLNVLQKSKFGSSCDCDLECTCSARAAPSGLTGNLEDVRQKHKQCGATMSDIMLGADEITVSESDNNSTMIKRKRNYGSKAGALHEERGKKFNYWCKRDPTLTANKNCDTDYNSSHIDIYSEGDIGDGVKGNESDDQRPPLPPRPPPPPRLRNSAANMNAARRHGSGLKKYVVWCLVCGGLSCILGILFLGIYFLLHSYTITVGNFETVPTFVPATLLILTGLCIMSLARRRNRYSYLIKLSGACGLISALTCALVTVTTTVLHMSRLQALRECEYAQKTRTCTCYSDMIESQVDRVDKEGVRLVFDSLSDCGVVHGSLYSCLRAIFGLSVAGVLIAVFSCMLVYQLLSHERKKMYWEQLELRCRSLYTSQQGPPPNVAAMSVGGRAICRCCEQCHAHRQVPLQAAAYPWDDSGEPRFWTGQPPGNFYSPNPGGDDMHLNNATTCRGHSVPSSRSRATGWSWPRMPWQRNSPDPNRRFRQTPSSPDSQYGFTNNGPNNNDNIMTEEAAAASHNMSAFNMVNGALPYGVWGPPPPYSDPNSPARRGYYQYIQPNACNMGGPPSERPSNAAMSEQHAPCLNHRSVFLDQPSSGGGACCAQQPTVVRNSAKRLTAGSSNANFKSKGGEYENTPSDSDGGIRDRFSNTLPTRKVKKRVEANGKTSIGSGSQPAVRVNVQEVFPDGTNRFNELDMTVNNTNQQANASLSDEQSGGVHSFNSVRISNKQTARHKRGVDNSAFQGNVEGSNNNDGMLVKEPTETCDPAESEVYFADVSSCCNISVKNDNYYEDATHHHHHHHHQHQNSSCSHDSTNSNSNNDNANEDYLAQRFGQRENSIRSRLPFPQSHNDDYEENLNVTTANASKSVSSNNHMQKEVSRQSMCSVESEAKTEYTDLSPSTPCSNKFTQSHFTSSKNKLSTGDLGADSSDSRTTLTNFIATFAFASESQSLEAYRRSTKDVQELMLTPEAHYEVINDLVPCQPEASPNRQASARNNNQCHNSLGNKQNDLTVQKLKTKNKLRPTLENSTIHQSDLDWSESNSNSGKSATERPCL